MIALNELSSAVAAQIFAKTKVFATSESLSCTAYPMFYVSARDKEIEVCDGGRQIMRRVEFVIAAHASRYKGEGEQNKLLMEGAAGLIPYFLVCGRRFMPENMTMGIDDGKAQLSFETCFCDLPPDLGATANTDMMGEILFEF